MQRKIRCWVTWASPGQCTPTHKTSDALLLGDSTCNLSSPGTTSSQRRRRSHATLRYWPERCCFSVLSSPTWTHLFCSSLVLNDQDTTAHAQERRKLLPQRSVRDIQYFISSRNYWWILDTHSTKRKIKWFTFLLFNFFLIHSGKEIRFGDYDFQNCSTRAMIAAPFCKQQIHCARKTIRRRERSTRLPFRYAPHP